MNVRTVNPGVENKKEKFLRTTGALATVVGVPQVIQPATAILACEGAGRLSRTLKSDQIELVNKSAEKILNEVTNLKQKGVEIIDARPLSSFGASTTKFKGTGIGAKIKNYLMDFLNPIQGIINGKNAGFIPEAGLIAYHPEKISLASFHEIGHAHNHHNSKIWKFIQMNCRNFPIALALGLGAFVALTKNSKPEEGKDLNFAQKTKNFIRNHAGKIALAGTLPMVAEEITASIKGCKWAYKLLDKNLARKVLASNALGAITYIGVGAFVALGIHLAKKIKDKHSA